MQRNLLFIPGPVTVSEPVLAAMMRPLVDHRGPEYAEVLGRIARRMAPLFGTKQPVLTLGASGTGALEAAVANLFSPGDKVLCCPVGVFGKRLMGIAQNYGLDVEALPTEWGRALDPDALRGRLRAAGGAAIRGILLTHNETSTGVQCDMAALSAAIGDHPATTVVDSVSGLGASAFAMDAWGYDVVVTASQKAIAAPPGISMLALSERAWQRAAGARCPRYYFDLSKAREFAPQGQTPWTPPVSIAFALDAALDHYHAEGMPAAFARHERYARAVRAAATALGLSLVSAEGAHSVTVVAIRMPEGISGDAVRKSLRTECGVVVGGGQLELKDKILRFGVMGALTQTDILGAVGALEIVLLQQGHHLQVGTGARAALEVFLETEAAARV